MRSCGARPMKKTKNPRGATGRIAVRTCYTRCMSLEPARARKDFEDPVHRKESREIQALLTEYGVAQSAERIKSGEMIRAVARTSSSSMSFGELMDSSGSSGPTRPSYTFYV